MLVIGNPPAGPDFASLWGAAAEAVEVAAAFDAPTDPTWQVTARIWDGRGELHRARRSTTSRRRIRPRTSSTS